MHSDGSPLTLKPGHNCLAVATADRAAVLIDGEAYFKAFVAACEQAESHIIILGWDLDFFTPLHRGREPDELGSFLHDLLRRKRRLHLYLLTWDYSSLYVSERGLWSQRTRFWRRRRAHVVLDDAHPLSGSQHQKVVVIDDQLAFCGGLDLSQERWDTPEHRVDAPERKTHLGERYHPFHDVHAMVSGEAARVLGDVARARWHAATGRRMHQTQRQTLSHRQRWPEGVPHDFEGISTGVSRTAPKFDGHVEVREIERWYGDAIAGARHTLYLENQYLTSAFVREALSRSLAQPTGPEIVVVGPATESGWLEQNTMGLLRGRFVHFLRQADRYSRLRVYSPVVGDTTINVHAKVMIVDDTWLHIGSSNLTNRSMGLDSECDLTFEARTDDERGRIRGVRARLLSEHTGLSVEQCQESTSLFALIDQQTATEHRLAPMPSADPGLIGSLIDDEMFFDTERPAEATRVIDDFLRGRERAVDRRPFRYAAYFLAAIALLAALWRWTPLAGWLHPSAIAAQVEHLRALPAAPVILALVFAGASLLLVPITLLLVQVGAVLGAWQGMSIAFTGIFLSASVGFFLGKLASRRVISRLAGDRLRRLNRLFQHHAVISVAIVRVFPIAPFTVINVVGGASGCSYRAFIGGTLIGMAPGVVALTYFGRGVFDLLIAPTWTGALTVSLICAGVLFTGYQLRGRLRGRMTS